MQTKNMKKLTVTIRFISHLCKILLDKAADCFNAALPLTPSSAAAPQVMNKLIRDYGTYNYLSQFEVADTTCGDIKAPSSNCENAIISLFFNSKPNNDELEQLPETVYVKLPSADILTRSFCNILGIPIIESHFYKHLAHKVNIRTPRVYAAANKRSRFVLMLENLNEDKTIQLMTNRVMVGGISIETAKQCLTTLAALHASFWDTKADDREALLPIRLHPFLSESSQALNYVLGHGAFKPCQKKAPVLMTDDIKNMYYQALSKWDRLLIKWYQEPLTLIHGDSHIGNFFIYKDNKMGMLDWQAVQWGSGIRDVQYLLISTIKSDLLAVHEKELVEYYISELEEKGVSLEFEKAWGQYRAYSFQTLLTEIVSLGLGKFEDHEEILLVLLSRAIAAVRRLKFQEWLNGV